ncbi:(d)CMP kinase [Clostridium sp. LBM24168]
MNVSVAIDGPAAAGKSTIANMIAKKFGFIYINTGSMYRAVTLVCLRSDINCKDTNRICNLIKSMDMCFENNRIIVNGEDVEDEIRNLYITRHVSDYAAIKEVRDLLVSIQQNMSNKYNVVMDGRDIGTVVLKSAPLKFFLTASPEARAKRRYYELIKKDSSIEYNRILNDILKRDQIDSNRKEAPLKKACDAIEIDSSDLSIDQVVDIISNYIKKYMESLRS